MAHLAKYNKQALGHMFDHYEHKKQRDNIDQSRTKLNYNLAKDIQELKPMDFIESRLMLGVKTLNRKDVNYMCDWVVTLPKDVRPEDQEKFFKSCFDFLNNRYGQENCISCWVHLDETRSHMHYSYLPITINRGKDSIDYPEKLSAKEVNSKRDLQSFHNDLNRYISKVLGYEVAILNGETKEGNKTITELKRQSELQKQKEYIEQTQKIIQEQNIKANKAQKEVDDILKQIQGYNGVKKALNSKIKELKDIHQDTMEQIKDIANNFNLYNELLERHILSGNYKFVNELQNDIKDAQEAKEVLYYLDGIEMYQNDEPTL